MLQRTLNLYKTSYSGLPREIWLLSMTMLVNRAGTMVVPFMTLYLTSPAMGFSLMQASFVIALFGAGSILGAFVGGQLTDRFGFHKIQMFCLLTGGLLFMAVGQLRYYPLICVFTFLLSLFNDGYRPATYAALAHFSPPAMRVRCYALHRLAINLGWALGTTMGGMLAARNYELLFWIDGLTNLAAATLLFIWLKPATTNQSGTKPEPFAGVPSLSVYRDKRYLVFIALTTIYSLCFFQYCTTFPSYFRDTLYLSEGQIGRALALNGLIIVLVEMVLVGKLERMNRSAVFIATGTLLCGLSYFMLLLPLPAEALTLSVVVVLTIGEMFSMPLMNNYWVNRSTPGNRGQYAGLYTIAWSLGQTLGPVLCARVAQAGDFDAAFVLFGLLFLLASIGLFLVCSGRSKLITPKKYTMKKKINQLQALASRHAEVIVVAFNILGIVAMLMLAIISHSPSEPAMRVFP